VASAPTASLEDLWASDVFTLDGMKAVLPGWVYKWVRSTIEKGGRLDLSVANVVANVVAEAMKTWATSRGALYYAHVFYPLTNSTAEKHGGFISPQGDGRVITEFTGLLLVQGEPDGSSFPNGGIRSTFEARGCTAWDITRPAYLTETPTGVTLCIPPAHLRRDAVCAMRVHQAQGPNWVKTSDTGCCREGDSFSLAQRP